LLEDAIPWMQQGFRVGAHWKGNKMIFESADGTFGSIAMMSIGWSQLEVDFLVLHEVIESFGSFIVETLQPGMEPSLFERGQDHLVCLDDGRHLMIRDWFTEDVIAVATTQCKNTIVAHTGWHNKLSSQV